MGFYGVMEVALSGMDGEAEVGMKWEHDLPLDPGHPAAKLLPDHLQSNSSLHSGVPSLLSFPAVSFHHSSACLLVLSPARLLLEQAG